MKKIVSMIAVVLTLGLAVFLAPTVMAATSTPLSTIDMLKAVATGGGYKEQSLPVIVGTIIRAALSLLGAVFIILMVIGGYKWMMSEGNEQKIEQAQNYIRRAIIGLIITLSSWAIWTFLFEQFIVR